MNLETKKLEFIQWLSTIDNPSVIEKKFFIRDNEKEDWWDDLSDLEKESIHKGIEDTNEGKLKVHEEARKIYGKWLYDTVDSSCLIRSIRQIQWEGGALPQ